MDPIWNTLMLENLEAYKSGEKLPHIITKPFMEVFTVWLGGSGMTLAVIIILAFFMKSKQSKDIGRLALTPIIVTIFNYFIMATGLVPIPTDISVPWTVPIVLNGILATNSILGGVLSIIDFIIVGLIWYPFLKIMDKQNLSV